MRTNLEDIPFSTDAFASPDTWIKQPVLAYGTFLQQHQRLSASTQRVYLSMWEKFTSWLDSKGVALAHCEAGHIAQFLDNSSLAKAHRQRYVRLIEKIYRHLIEIGISTHNPGAKAAIEGLAVGENDDTRYLTKFERQLIIGYLQKMIRGEFQTSSFEQGEEKETNNRLNRLPKNSVMPSAIRCWR